MQFLEEFKVLLRNNSNKLLGVVDISVGSKDGVMVDMRVIFSIALKASDENTYHSYDEKGEWKGIVKK